MSEIFLCGGAADATVLSNVFIDEYLKDANDAQLKVYLFLVRRLQAGDPVSISDMADRFNHTEKDILRALCYWLMLSNRTKSTCKLHRSTPATQPDKAFLCRKLR